MSKKSTDWATTGFHGMARGFANNPNNNRQAVAQNMYANHLIELCANRFEWLGLPESVDPRYLEMTLLQKALAVFFKDEGDKSKGFTDTGEFYVLPAAGGGMPNVQDVPTHFQVTAPNINLNVQLSGTGMNKNCVPIWSNYLRRPELDKIAYFSQKLATIERTLEIASSNLRRTKLLTVPENKRTTYVNLMRQYDEGASVLFGVDGLDIEDAITAIDVGGDPDSVPRLRDEKNQIWNECMTMLGINNSNQDKRERLVASEVSANDEQVESTRNIALNSRQYAAEQINKLFKLNVTVDFRVKKETEDAEDGDNDSGNENNDGDKPEIKVVA